MSRRKCEIRPLRLPPEIEASMTVVEQARKLFNAAADAYAARVKQARKRYPSECWERSQMESMTWKERVGLGAYEGAHASMVAVYNAWLRRKAWATPERLERAARELLEVTEKHFGKRPATVIPFPRGRS